MTQTVDKGPRSGYIRNGETKGSRRHENDVQDKVPTGGMFAPTYRFNSHDESRKSEAIEP